MRDSKSRFHRTSAICTLAILSLLATVPPAVHAGEREMARYERAQIVAGAKTMPVLARLCYRDAISELQNDNSEAAQALLFKALAYDPDYPDPYFTLVRVKAMQLDPEAAAFVVEAFMALARSFQAHGLLLVNAVALGVYLLILVTLILCVALAIKYFPFAGHQIREILHTRFRAAMPGFSAYLLLLTPLVLFPGVITSLAYLTVVCWIYMYRRERAAMLVLLVPFIALGLFGNYLKPLSTVADPKSLTSLISRANNAPGDRHLIRAIEKTEVPGLESERHFAAGLLYERAGDYADASDHFFAAISANPEDPKSYINLGNVHFLQGRYSKALEGYRKAESLEAMDAVCQHDLAQAYIKKLLLQEASKALLLAADLGIEKVKASYAEGTLERLTVFPKTMPNDELWRAAMIEGRSTNKDILDELLAPFTRFPKHVSAWILLVALAVGLLLSRLVSPAKLTFQCSNCGNLTCSNCCRENHDTNLCPECGDTIEKVSSEKVIDALLRQKRQAAVVKRGKSTRITTRILPGARDIFYGRVARAFRLSIFFSVSLIMLISKGFLVNDTMSVVPSAPLWQIVLPAVGIVLAYLMSWASKPEFKFHKRRAPRGTQQRKSAKTGPVEPARAA